MEYSTSCTILQRLETKLKQARVIIEMVGHPNSTCIISCMSLVGDSDTQIS